MNAVESQLVMAEKGLIQLLTPPLAHAVPSAGYIQAYPPGVRENAGQYSHAGVWAVMAAAALAVRRPGASSITTQQRDTPYRYFTYLSSAHRANHPEWGRNYGVEPYAMVADVYSQPPYVGRGGWSWYTGSAGWIYRAAVESIAGLHVQGDMLFFTPSLPSHWPEMELTLKRDERSMRFILFQGNAAQALERHEGMDARILQVAEHLRWKDLPSKTCFVIPLLASDEKIDKA